MALPMLDLCSNASREVFAVGTEMEMGYALVEQTRDRVRATDPAGAQAKLAGQETDGVPQRPGARERPEVEPPVFFADPRQRQAGERFARVDADMQETLVVPEFDVVPWRVLLDQARLQQQRFGFAGHRENLVLRDAVDQSPELDVTMEPPRGMEIRRQPSAQGLGLAHINHLAAAIAEDVYPRSVGNVLSRKRGRPLVMHRFGPRPVWTEPRELAGLTELPGFRTRRFRLT